MVILRPRIEETYGIRIREIHQVQDVFRIITDTGFYCLKSYDFQEEEIRFITRVLSCMDEHGFTRGQRVYPTLEQSAYMTQDGLSYTLTNWVDGKRPDFHRMTDLKKGLRTLAKFHSAAEGFPAGVAPAARIRYSGLYSEVSEYKEQMGSYHNTGHLVPLCEEVLEHLREPKVIAAIDAEQKAFAFVHGDYNYPNLIKDKQGRLHLIDFENSSLHVRMKDLSHILHRNYTWNAAGMLRAVDYYQRHRQLSSSDLFLLHALLSAPYHVVRNIKIGGIRSARRVIPTLAQLRTYQKELRKLLI